MTARIIHSLEDLADKRASSIAKTQRLSPEEIFPFCTELNARVSEAGGG